MPRHKKDAPRFYTLPEVEAALRRRREKQFYVALVNDREERLCEVKRFSTKDERDEEARKLCRYCDINLMPEASVVSGDVARDVDEAYRPRICSDEAGEIRFRYFKLLNPFLPFPSGFRVFFFGRGRGGPYGLVSLDLGTTWIRADYLSEADIREAFPSGGAHEFQMHVKNAILESYRDDVYYFAKGAERVRDAAGGLSLYREILASIRAACALDPSARFDLRAGVLTFDSSKGGE